LYTFVTSLLRAKCLTYLVLDVTILIVFAEKYEYYEAPHFYAFEVYK
jgi:hypothetical protein